MNKRFWIIVLALVMLLLLPKLYWAIKAIPYREKQEQLAQTLGVNIHNYRRFDFPFDYFLQELKPGMPIREIHRIIRGYDRVLRCDDYAEVYLYFSPPGTDSFKYMILYDEKFFRSFITDDIFGDRTVSINGCVDGKLPE
ncbi:MAG: hypothetical protein HZB18_02735 [Chloroflexi bacterium]|nr:hypothetical protein [Chloroflexota bacterium]